MAAIALALGASLTWGLADFFGPLKSRTLGPLRVLVYAQLGGLTAIALIVAVRGRGPADSGAFLAVPDALFGTLGLYTYYRGMAVGAMSVVAPIASVSAVVPVAVGILSGDRPSALTSFGIVCALGGVFLAAREPQRKGSRLAAVGGLALLAAIGFGGYFPLMHAACALGNRRTVHPARRDRRHDREPPLRCRLLAGTRQRHLRPRFALPDRHGRPRTDRARRARGPVTGGRIRPDARRRRLDLRGLERELRYTALDLVAEAANRRLVLSRRVRQVPVEVTLAGQDGAGVATAHRHDEVRPLGVGLLQPLRLARGELRHDRRHLGVDALGRRCPGRATLAAAPLVERLRNLRTPRVLPADEQDVCHPPRAPRRAPTDSGTSR